MKKRSKDSFFGDVMGVLKNDLGRAKTYDDDPIDERDVCPEDELEDVDEPDEDDLCITEEDIKKHGQFSEAEIKSIYAELKCRGDKSTAQFIESLIKAADDYRNDADLSKETIKSMEKDHKKLLENINSLETRIEDFVKLRELSDGLVKENDELKKENDELKKENVELKKQLEESTDNGEAEKKLKGLNQQIEELKAQLESKNAEVSRMLDREEELQDQLKEHKADIAEKDTELRRLSQEVTSRGIEIQQLREEIKLVEAAVPKKKKKFYFRLEDTNHMSPLVIDEVKEIMVNYPRLKVEDLFAEYLLPVDYKGELIVPFTIPERKPEPSPKKTSKKDKAASKTASNSKAGEQGAPTT